ncbi:hypothetical protein Tco_1269084 [Tanacetum coccineum]
MDEPLGAEVDEPLVDPVIDELAELIVEGACFEGPRAMKKVWEMDEECMMAPITPPPMPVMPPPSTYEVGGSSTAATEGHSFTLLAPEITVPSSDIKDLCTRMVNLEYGHGLLLKKVIMVSDAEVADNIAIGEISPRVSTVEGQVLASQMVQVHKGVQIQQLQTLVAEMSSREGPLMQCILGLDRRLTDAERRPPGPQ